MNPDSLPTTAAQLASHLSPDDLDAVLLGIATPHATAHAAACPVCAQHLQSFGSTLNLFNQASLSWAVAKSNTIDRDLTTHRPHSVLTLGATRSYVAAVLVAAIIMFTAGFHYRALTLEAANGSSLAADSVSTEDEIASDNALLQGIDSELRRPDPLPAVLAGDPQDFRNRQVSN